MKPNKPNQNNPFGTFNDAEREVRRPKDVTSDQWIPISSGATGNRTPNGAPLHDRDLDPAPRTEPAARQQRHAPQPKKAPQKSKKKDRKKKPATSAHNPPNPSKQRSVVQGTRRDALQRSRVVQEYEQKQLTRREKEYQKQISEGKSGDELRLRRAKRSRRSKRMTAGLTAGLILAVVLIVVAVYCFTYGIPVANITVSGTSIYSTEEILNASGVSKGDNMLAVRQKKVNDRICSTLPYIASVRVEYRWPDTLKLTVKADVEKYIIVTADGFICIDQNDKIVSVKEKKLKAGKYRLEGFDAQTVSNGTVFVPQEENAKRLETAKRIVESIEESGLQAKCVLDLSDVYGVVLLLDDRVNVYLGDGVDSAKRMKLIAQTFSERFGQQSTGYIDARFSTGLYYKLGNRDKDASS